MRASLTKPGKQLTPCSLLFKSIFLPIRFLSGSTARTDKFLESQARSHYSQLGPPSLNISQVFKLVKCSPVASCLGSSLPGRNPSRLAPTNVGTPCAFLTGREKCGLVTSLRAWG